MPFQTNAFQFGAFQAGFRGVTDTDVLQKPVGYVLANSQPIEDRYREFDIRPMNLKETVQVRASSAGRLRGERPSFSITTSRKGHD